MSEIGQSAVDEIKALVGLDYIYLGDDPTKGLDCITLTSLVYKIIGKATRRPELWTFPMPVGYTVDELDPAELRRWHQFWSVVNPGTFGSIVEFEDHIGTYIGSGEIIHCQARKGVIITRATALNFLKPRWLRLKVQLAAERP